MRTLLIHGTILTVNDQHEVILDGALGFEEDRIIYVGHTPKMSMTMIV